jgi:Glycosyltransferase
MVYRHAAARWLRNATAVICVSNHEARKFASRFPALADRVVVVPCPIRAALTPTPLPHDAKSLLSIGRLEHYKRFDLSILALCSLPGWHLTLIGDGPERRNLERLVRTHGVDKRVTFAGSVSDHAMSDHLRNATCVLQLSTLESFGMTTLEAVAAGRPVVVAAGGAPAELGEAFPGWVHESPSLNLADIVSAIERASSSVPAAAPDLRPFDPDRFVESTLQIYQGVISSAGHQWRR